MPWRACQKEVKINQKLNRSEKFITFDQVVEQEELVKKIEFIYSRDFDLFGYSRISSQK